MIRKGKKMEVTIEKADGSPLSKEDTAALLGCLRDHLGSVSGAGNTAKPRCKSGNPDELEIMIDEDCSNVYAVALCPGVPRDRIEVSIRGNELSIRSIPVKKEEKNASPFLWRCIEELSYEGERDLPTDVIPEQATAELADGVLYVTLPKTDAVKPKIVSVS